MTLHSLTHLVQPKGMSVTLAAVPPTPCGIEGKPIFRFKGRSNLIVEEGALTSHLICYDSLFVRQFVRQWQNVNSNGNTSLWRETRKAYKVSPKWVQESLFQYRWVPSPSALSHSSSREKKIGFFNVNRQSSIVNCHAKPKARNARKPLTAKCKNISNKKSGKRERVSTVRV